MPSRPSRPHAPARSGGRPLDVATCLVLTVGLIGCAAPAAHAADTPTTPSTAAATAGSSSAPNAVEHPALERTVTAVFTPRFIGVVRGVDYGIIYKADFTVRLTNTGDVPLTVVFDALEWGRESSIPLAVGETKEILDDDNLDEYELPGGAFQYTDAGVAYTPSGAQIDASIDVRLPVPTWDADHARQPSTAPTGGPGTPTPDPTTSPTSAPRVTVTIDGTFQTQPGELVKEGTRVAFAYTVKNTGGVNLTDVLGRKLAVGESFLLTTTEAVVTAQNLKDGFIAAESKDVRGTLPDGQRIVVSPAFEYKLPIPEKPPIPVPAPDLDVKVTGTFDVKEGEPVVAGTKVTWVAAITNTGNVDLRDVKVADSDALASLPVGSTGVVSYESVVTDRDVFNHSIFIAALATATAPDGTEYTEQTLGSLAIPAVIPVPIGPDAQQTATPIAGAASRLATEISTAATPAAAAASAVPSSQRSTAGHLASTGSDAAAALPAAGVLALLGALGVLLGRRRRRSAITD